MGWILWIQFLLKNNFIWFLNEELWWESMNTLARALGKSLVSVEALGHWNVWSRFRAWGINAYSKWPWVLLHYVLNASSYSIQNVVLTFVGGGGGGGGERGALKLPAWHYMGFFFYKAFFSLSMTPWSRGEISMPEALYKEVKVINKFSDKDSWVVSTHALYLKAFKIMISKRGKNRFHAF